MFETPDGHEKTMVVNVFAPLLLSFLMLEPLSKSSDGRIVTMSSASHSAGGKFFPDDIELKSHYSFTKVYGLSKLYVIWVMRGLIEEIKRRKLNITVNITHPASTRTGLGVKEGQNRPLWMDVVFALWRVMLIPMEKAAQPMIDCAISDAMKGSSMIIA